MLGVGVGVVGAVVMAEAAVVTVEVGAGGVATGVVVVGIVAEDVPVGVESVDGGVGIAAGAAFEALVARATAVLPLLLRQRRTGF